METGNTLEVDAVNTLLKAPRPRLQWVRLQRRLHPQLRHFFLYKDNNPSGESALHTGDMNYHTPLLSHPLVMNYHNPVGGVL